MPQIDTVTYFPIVLWSLILLISGYVLLNLFGLLWLCNISKIGSQWISYQLRAYWIHWNVEETADGLAWTYSTAPVLRLENQKE